MKWVRWDAEDSEFCEAYALVKDKKQVAWACDYLVGDELESRFEIRIYSKQFNRGYIQFGADYASLGEMQIDVIQTIEEMYTDGA